MLLPRLQSCLGQEAWAQPPWLARQPGASSGACPVLSPHAALLCSTSEGLYALHTVLSRVVALTERLGSSFMRFQVQSGQQELFLESLGHPNGMFRIGSHLCSLRCHPQSQSRRPVPHADALHPCQACIGWADCSCACLQAGQQELFLESLSGHPDGVARSRDPDLSCIPTLTIIKTKGPIPHAAVLHPCRGCEI